jgi:hypothetical protein
MDNSNGEIARNTTILSVIRRLLLGILLLGLLGTGAELLLLNHTEEPRQWIPLLLILSAFLVSGWHWVRPTAISTRIFQWLMIAFIAGGCAGLYFHYQGSVEFKLESKPSLNGWALFWEAIRGKAPPALAPGAMIQLGLIGLAYTYRHPALIALTESRSQDKGE